MTRVRKRGERKIKKKKERGDVKTEIQKKGTKKLKKK